MRRALIGLAAMLAAPEPTPPSEFISGAGVAGDEDIFGGSDSDTIGGQGCDDLIHGDGASEDAGADAARRSTAASKPANR